jgi:hypothetical protein
MIFPLRSCSDPKRAADQNRRHGSVSCGLPLGLNDKALRVATHIALTGDYVWANSDAAADFKPLRDFPTAFLARATSRTILYKSCGDP